ncbi:MAG: hypothetical protein CMI01_18625 [Oceanospirillaceae bacterium]|nr:hypothetical protein [Oceanospirillaceae bacterium]
MIWNLVATLFAGLGAAGIALILRSLSRKKLPKWIIPVFAGAGMLAYSIYIEYTWFEFKSSKLPEGAVVVAENAPAMLWRPWTYLFPMTSGFTVLDTNSVAVKEIAGDPVAQFTLYRFEKAHVDQVRHDPYLLNCAKREMVRLNEEGQPMAGSLKQLPANDRLLNEACKGA